MKNGIFDPITGILNEVTKEKDKSTVDYILQDVMKNSEPTDVQKEFILMRYPKNRILLIGDEKGGDVFKVIKNDDNSITLQPLGTNTFAVEKFDFDKRTNTVTQIIDGKIVIDVVPL